MRPQTILKWIALVLVCVPLQILAMEDSDGDGLPDAIESREGRDPFLKDNDVYQSTRLFVQQIFRDYLLREANEEASTYWQNEVSSGRISARSLVLAFIDSNEAQRRYGALTRLYFAYFSRSPDLAGLMYWLVENPSSINLVADAFAVSQEFINQYGALDDEQFVTLVYRNALGRDPDGSGRAHWVNQLRTAGLTRGRLMLVFSESAEFKRRSLNRVYVSMVFTGMLNRSPDPAGFAHWVSQLEQGLSVKDFIFSVLYGSEYRERLLGTTRLNLISAGDIAQCAPNVPAVQTAAERTAKLVESMLRESRLPSQVLTLGDNVYYTGTAEEYQTCYQPTWGRFKSRTWAVAGNHDYGVANATPYYDYFGAAAGPDRRGYWRLDRAGWTIISVNSNIDVTVNSPQLRWLDAELATTKGCLLVAWHHPRFTSSPRGDSAYMNVVWTRLVQAKADLVLAGHEHNFERFAPLSATGAIDPAGVRSMIVGTGGASLTNISNLPAPRIGSESRYTAYGVLQMTLQAGRMQWSFVDDGKVVRDHGSIECRAKS